MAAALSKIGKLQTAVVEGQVGAPGSVQDLEGRFHKLVAFLEDTLGDFAGEKSAKSVCGATIKDRLEELEVAVGLSARRHAATLEAAGLDTSADLSATNSQTSSAKVPS